FADEVSVAAEAPPPEGVGQHNGTRARRTFFSSGERAPQLRSDPQERKEIRGHLADTDLLGVPLAGQGSSRHPDSPDTGEQPASPPQLDQLRAGGGHAGLLRVAVL